MNQTLKVPGNPTKPRTANSTRHNSVVATEIENYFPKERRYRSPMTGEIKLDRSIIRLLTPVLDNVTIRPSKLPPNISIPTNPEVTEFFKVANTPLRKKLNYKYCVMRSIEDFRSLSLPNQKVSEIQNIIPRTPYSSSKAHSFIKACKFGSVEEVELLLGINPNLVYCFDNLSMTGLHWAALRNFVKVARCLLENHCLVNAIDVNHRTPLFEAVRKGNLEVSKVLLEYKADPTLASHSKKTPLKVSKNPKVTEMLKTFLIFHNHCRVLSKQAREEYWETHTLPYLKTFK